MNTVLREDQVSREHDILSSDAAFSDESEGRARSADPDMLRNDYQRDRDKILHAKSFRRLSHKTQVFLAAEGDHYRTRLTHTLEVAQIARTAARALGLNEDLTEAVALGHDLGHTPFGHTGEDALSKRIAHYRGGSSAGARTASSASARTTRRIPSDRSDLLFRHNEQSLRVVEVIENGGRGLNLTSEVRDGIYCHTGTLRAETLEGRIVAETNGQPLPLFIKWDDTEYSLRAARNGFPTVTWPGAAIWHMAWADKDDAIDWQAYFHLRNRLIVAAMYHEGPAKGITKSIFKSTLKHTMCMEYSTMAIQIEAMRDFLAGPDHLFDILESSLPRIAQIRKNYSDAVILESADELPAPTGAPGVPTRNIGGRLAKIKKIPWAIKGLKHLVSKEDAAHHEAPQLNLTPDEARWFTLSRVDSATVSTAGGTGVAFRKRDRDLAKDLVAQTRELLKEIEENFDDLRAEYRAAQPELTSRESWKKVFDAQ